MGEIISPKTEHTVEQNKSLMLCYLRRRYEYLLLLIPSVAYVINFGLPRGNCPFINTFAYIVLYSILILLPIVLCLFIITIKYRKYDIKTTLSHYASVGFALPFILSGCMIISRFVGWFIPDWRSDASDLFWTIILAIPASLVTAIIGSVMRLILKGGQRCITVIRS